MDRPRTRDDGPLRTPPFIRPIGYNVWLGEGSARPGSIYTLDGQDYSAEQAAQLVRPYNEERWTWRPVRAAEER